MTTARMILPAAIALALVSAACSDTTEPEEEALTEQEATDLLNGYRALMLQEEPTIISATENGAVIACPLGGQMEVVGGGQEDFAGDTVRLNLDINTNPTGCRVGGSGAWYDLTGDPGVRERINVEIVGFFESFDVSGTTTGNVAWESGERSGTCEIDLALTAVPDLTDPANPAVRGTLAGMLCGNEVEIDVADLPIE